MLQYLVYIVNSAFEIKSKNKFLKYNRGNNIPIKKTALHSYDLYGNVRKGECCKSCYIYLPDRMQLTEDNLLRMDFTGPAFIYFRYENIYSYIAPCLKRKTSGQNMN